MSRELHVALVHHPVLDRAGAAVTTALTNLDLHDLARSSRAYGARALHVVHPIEAQRALAARIREHWVTGSGKERIPDRAAALERVRIAASLEDVWADVAGGRAGVEVWTTSTRQGPKRLSFGDGAARLRAEGPPVVLLFGTGWGLHGAVVDDADAHVEPISGWAPEGEAPWNHLSVRAACAIALDRLRARP